MTHVYTAAPAHARCDAGCPPLTKPRRACPPPQSLCDQKLPSLCDQKLPSLCDQKLPSLCDQKLPSLCDQKLPSLCDQKLPPLCPKPAFHGNAYLKGAYTGAASRCGAGCGFDAYHGGGYAYGQTGGHVGGGYVYGQTSGHVGGGYVYGQETAGVAACDDRPRSIGALLQILGDLLALLAKFDGGKDYAKIFNGLPNASAR